MIKLIIGLGNPGSQYAKTRHNAGFWFLDDYLDGGQLAFRANSSLQTELCQWQFGMKKIIVCKPTTFMNLSGSAVQKVMHFYKIEAAEMLVVHDELDLPAGVAKLKRGGGHGGHNGLRDIVAKTGQKDFMRLRVGIDHPGSKHLVANYVLTKPSQDDKDKIETALTKAAAVMNDLLDGDEAKAMNHLHSMN